MQRPQETFLYFSAELFDSEIQYYLIDVDKLISSRHFQANTIFGIRQVIVTPTRVIYQKPQYTGNTRIITMYGREYFLIATFRDEDKISALQGRQDFTLGDDDEFDELLQHTIVNRLHDGLHICGRIYRYLGGSNSSSIGAKRYLVADHYDRDYEYLATSSNIRSAIGDLSPIKCVAAYEARCGLAFTEIKASISTDKCNIRLQCRDIKTTGYCFSDGIGRISTDLARQLVSKLKVSTCIVYMGLCTVSYLQFI